MNKKKVDLLLINPPFHRRNGSGSIFPLGLGYIIAAAKKEGYTCDVINGYSMIDSYANESLSDFEIKLQNLLETYDPVLVGIGPCITTQLRALQIIARCCLTIYGDDRVYAGGPLASIDGQEWLFFELLRIRYIVKGDGEEAICQMIRCLKNGGSLAQCNYVSRSGYLYRNEVADINKLAFPERPYLMENVFSLRRKHNDSVLSASMVTLRGCKYRCHYCVSGNMNYQKFRKRSNANIVAEMQFLATNYQINDIIFYDDCFFSNPESIYQDVSDFCTALIERNLSLTWQMELRCDAFLRLREIDFVLLKNAGCRQINLGIEKTYVAGLQKLGKNIPLHGLAEHIKFMKDCSGIQAAGTFILGGKNETETEVLEVIEKSTTLNLDFAHYNPLFVYPGTPLYKEYFTNDISERKWVDYLLKDSWPWGEIVYENENLSREMILNLTEKAYERFYADSPYKDNEMVKDRFRLGISI